MRISFYTATAIFATIANGVWITENFAQVEQIQGVKRPADSVPLPPVGPLPNPHIKQEPLTVTTDSKFSNYKFSGGTPEQLEGLVSRLAKTVPACCGKPPINGALPGEPSEEAIRKAAKEKADADEKVVKEMKEADEKAAKDIKEVAEKKK